MSISRRNRRAIDKHLNELGIILSRFYDFLSKSDKPSDEEVRNKFIEYEKEWLSYCLKKHLSPYYIQSLNTKYQKRGSTNKQSNRAKTRYR